MINLIAPKEKQKFSIERIKRMIIVLWSLLFFFIICLVLVFLAVMIYAKSQLAVQKSVAESIKEKEKIEKIEQTKQKVQLVNSSLQDLNYFYDGKIYFSSLIERISNTLPQGIYLNSCSIITVEGEGLRLEVSLAGLAPTREDLLQFKSNLEQEEDFLNISFPPSNWVKKVDIDFSVSFEINP